MDKIMEILRSIPHGFLVVEGRERTFVCVPLWLVILAVLGGRHAFSFAVLTALLIVGFGMRVSIEQH